MSGELALSLILKYQDRGSSAAVRTLAQVEKALKSTDSAGRQATDMSTKLERSLKFTNATARIAADTVGKVTDALKAASNVQPNERTTSWLSRIVSEGGAAQRVINSLHGGMQRMHSTLAKFGALQAGWAAGKMILGPPVKQTMDYDRQLAHLSNTAYAGKSMDARRAGMRTLDAAIISAVRTGGGTREGSLETLDKLVASGAYENVGDAAGVLPVLAKAGTASNASPTELADIAIRARQTFGISDVGGALNMAMKAGQLGGFELKDMAKWLPQQMAMARQSGLRGPEGFATLLAANQATAITAGTKDEAGNNLVNLLAKINSQDTARDAKKLGINLPGSLAAAREKGVNSLDAFVNLTDQIVARDKSFGTLRSKAAHATGDERKATYESMGDILQGSAVGKIVQDRQALMALVGIMNNRDYMQGIRNKVGNANGTTDDAFSLVAGTASYKTEQLVSEKAVAMQTAMDRINPSLGNFADNLAKTMRDWPGFSASIVAATTGLTALAAAVGAGGLAKMFLGGSAGSAAATAAAGATALGGTSMLPFALTGLAGVGIVAKMQQDEAAAHPGQHRVTGPYGISRWADGAAPAQPAAQQSGGSAGAWQGMANTLAPQLVKVVVEVKDGNITASVNDANARTGRRF
ncbi:MAG: phage protein [Rhodocyclales bacterium]|nr:phage protein [Rhodocyclales bacterium]